MDSRARALEAIVAIARQHGVTPAEIAAALGEPRAGAPVPESRAVPGRRGALVHVLAYLGATFVFAGVGVFIALHWDSMNAVSRLVVTLGSGVAAFALAVLSVRDPRFARAAPPLFLVAAALEPTGMVVAFDEFGSGGDWRWASLVSAGTMAAQFLVASLVLQLTTTVFLTMGFATLFWWTALDLIRMDDELAAIVVGGSLIAASVGVDRTAHRNATPLWYFVGAAALLIGLFEIVEGTVLEIVFLGAAAGLVYASAMLHSRTLLAVATLGILAYTGYFTGQHFAESVGWPIALVAFGLFMIGLSALAFRIDRDYVRSGRDRPA